MGVNNCNLDRASRLKTCSLTMCDSVIFVFLSTDAGGFYLSPADFGMQTDT